MLLRYKENSAHGQDVHTLILNLPVPVCPIHKAQSLAVNQ